MFPMKWELNLYILSSLNSIFEVISWLIRGTVIFGNRLMSRYSECVCECVCVCESSGGQSDTVAGIPSSPYCFPFQHNSTNIP
jgi:hypothetical protein